MGDIGLLLAVKHFFKLDLMHLCIGVFVIYYIVEVNCLAKLCVLCAFLVFVMGTRILTLSKRIVFQDKVLCLVY